MRAKRCFFKTPFYPRLSEAEFLRIAEINVAAINAATAHLPSEKVGSREPEYLTRVSHTLQVRMHLCWGNWHGPHHHDIDIEKIFQVIQE